MTLRDRLRQLASALPSDDAAVSFTRADLLALAEEDEAPAAPTRELTVDDVAEETGRAPSTVRGWLITRALRGYKLNGREWRVPRPALQQYLASQKESSDAASEATGVDITAWRSVRGA